MRANLCNAANMGVGAGLMAPQNTSLKFRLMPSLVLLVLFILVCVNSNGYRSNSFARSGLKSVNGGMHQKVVAAKQVSAQQFRRLHNLSTQGPSSIALSSEQINLSSTRLKSNAVPLPSKGVVKHAELDQSSWGSIEPDEIEGSQAFRNKETKIEVSKTELNQDLDEGLPKNKIKELEKVQIGETLESGSHGGVESRAEESSQTILDHRPSLKNRCQKASAARPTAFFTHCSVPNRKGVKKLESHVKKRLAAYKGNPDCSDELLEFHCLEYASQQEGWCDWSSAPSVEPAPEDQFLVRPSRHFADGLVEPVDREDHRLVFFYPSYAFLPSLERSIVSLQHPKHVFLIAVDAPKYADLAFVSGAKDLAIALNDRFYNNVFLFQGGKVLYETSTQILVAWPFMAWALEYVTGWTHFILTDAQTYPLHSNEELRKVLWERQNKVFFTRTPYEVSTGPDFEGDSRRYEEVLPLCEGDRDGRHVNYQQASAMGSWTDEAGEVRDGFKRIDWLDKRLGTGWDFGKTGGNMVIVPRNIVQFLVHAPEGKMWTQYFKYMVDACEHLIVSVVHYYFRERVAQDYSSCFMLWGGGPENVILSESDIESIGNGSERYLFARKFRVPDSSDLLDKIDNTLRID